MGLEITLNMIPNMYNGKSKIFTSNEINQKNFIENIFLTCQELKILEI